MRRLREELDAAEHDSGRHRDAVDVVRVFGVLTANVYFSGWGSRGAGNRLLQDLGSRVGRRPVVLLLLESLVTRPCIDRERDCGGHCHTFEADGHWG